MKTMIKHALLAGIAAIPMAVPVASTAHAQTATRSYSIAAQPLDDALRQFASQSGRDVVFDPKLVEGKTSAALQGSFTAESGLRQLLKGTGVNAFSTSNGFAIRGNGAAELTSDESEPLAPSEYSTSPSTVVDARTGSALKGALVELVGTGEKTSTGDLGEFRFPGRSGRVQLRISYLGYPVREETVELRDGRAQIAIALIDDAAAGEIVVTGQRSARAQALNQERTADNMSTVISDDLTGQFDGTTLPDALRRAPGVTFVPNQDSGDGTNVMVRGMAGAFNEVRLNGVQLSGSNGIDRSPNLEGILADSVSKVTINKTLLPSQSSSGTGALVEIETKGPLDRPDRYFSLSAEGALTPRGFLSDQLLSGVASFKFGQSKNLGVSLNAQYRTQDRRNYTFASQPLFGSFLPSGTASISEVDPRTKFPFDKSAADAYHSDVYVAKENIATENFSLGASLQWQIGQHTNLRFDYNRNETKSDFNQASLTFYSNAGYTPLPIDGLGGEERYALVAEDYGVPGILAGISNYYTNRLARVKTNVFSFEGKTELNSWDFSYAAGLTKARNSEDGISAGFGEAEYFNRALDREHISQDILGNTTAGRIISILGPAGEGEIPLPGLTPAGADYVYDNSNFFFQGGSEFAFEGESRRWGGSLDVKKNLRSPVLRYLQVGVAFDKSKSAFDNFTSVFYTSFIPVPMSALGLIPKDIGLENIGRSADIELIPEDQMLDFYESLSNESNGLISRQEFPPDPNQSKDFVQERKLSGYLQAFFTLGKFDLISGVRVEQIVPRAVTRYAPTIISATGVRDTAYAAANTDYLPFKARNTNILPRAVLNYRPNENVVLRMGYFRSIALPGLQEIGAGRSLTLDLRPRYGPSLNQPQLRVFTGNPGLKASSTDNFDISLEWYSGSIGVLKAGAFYKPTKRPFMTVAFLQQTGVPDDIELPDDPRFSTPNLFYTVTRPENSPFTAKLWGLEFAAERQFTFLPGWLGGFGFYGNYTYTHSEMTIGASYAPAPGGRVFIDVPYASQAPHSGTAALTYSKNGIAGTLAYTRQSAYASGQKAHGISSGLASVDSLDLKLQYSTKIGTATAKVYFEGSDLLKGYDDPSSVGAVFVDEMEGDFPMSTTYRGGRSFRLGLALTY